ncbi:DnaA ATPase domain-containing protein [Lactobacillus delbrueckii subsp. bulgaricus]
MNNVTGVALQAYQNAIKGQKTGQKCPKHGTELIYIKSAKDSITGHLACPECDRETLDSIAAAFEKKAAKEIKRSYFLQHSLASDDVFKCSFGSFTVNTKQEEALKRQIMATAKAYAEKPDAQRNTILYGKSGTGKSHLAMSLMKYVADHSDQKCVYVNIAKLFRRIKNSMASDYEYWTESTAEEIMTGCDLLCIDDLGTESSMGRQGQEASRWVQNILYDALENQKRIVITTNLNEEQLRHTYDAKLFSRIFRNSIGTRFSFDQISDKRLMGA